MDDIALADPMDEDGRPAGHLVLVLVLVLGLGLVLEARPMRRLLEGAAPPRSGEAVPAPPSLRTPYTSGRLALAGFRRPAGWD